MATSSRFGLARQADIDIGYDLEFEQNWGKFERVAWAVFAALILVACLGLFGRGPLNQVKRSLPDGTTVQYERVARFKTPSMVTFTLPVQNGQATIEASNDTVQKLGLQSVFPQPSQNLASSEVGPFRFQVPSRDTQRVTVQFSMQPSAIGPVISTYQVNGLTTLTIHQFIVP